MKILNSIKKRLSGNYRLQEKLDLINFSNELTKIIESRSIKDDRMLSYITRLKHFYKNEISVINLGRFIGIRSARILFNSKNFNQYDFMYSAFEQEDKLTFGPMIIPVPITNNDKILLCLEFNDILFQPLKEFYNFSLPDDLFIYDEGPYEIGKVRLKKDDIVFDCGANMGLFSALASVKGCKVYAFEPMEYIINTYLSKTAAWNKNITICPYALSDKKQFLSFGLNDENIGASTKMSSQKKESKQYQYQQVQAITIDEFVIENKLDRVDFIKADIEGAERYMLEGGRNTIRQFSPKISICTYHLPDDPKVLREKLLDIQPKYKITEKYKKMYAYVPD